MQKLLLARAIYKNGAIFILDEPTAALDPIAIKASTIRTNRFTSRVAAASR